jgi:hypothetical protein
MSYVDPQTVISPRRTVRSVDVLYNGGPGEWSVALLSYWSGEEKVGIRWNGEEGPGMGHPQSRANPTWFVLPGAIADVVRDRAELLNNRQEGGLLDGYRAMALDGEREAEAEEWSEGLISDAADQER